MFLGFLPHAWVFEANQIYLVWQLWSYTIQSKGTNSFEPRLSEINKQNSKTRDCVSFKSTFNNSKRKFIHPDQNLTVCWTLVSHINAFTQGQYCRECKKLLSPWEKYKSVHYTISLCLNIKKAWTEVNWCNVLDSFVLRVTAQKIYINASDNWYDVNNNSM